MNVAPIQLEEDSRALDWIREDSLSSEENLETTESTKKISKLMGFEIHEYELVRMRRQIQKDYLKSL